MNQPLFRSALSVIVPFLLATSLAAQAAPTLTRALPAAAGPGDLVILEGQNLGAITQVRFEVLLSTPSSTTVIQRSAQPLSVSPNRVTVILPQMSTRPPSPPAGLWPIGTIRAEAGSLSSPTLPFLMLELTASRQHSGTTLGEGSTQASALGKPLTSFDPTLGRFPFEAVPSGTTRTDEILLLNATPGSVGELYVGLPAANPSIALDDGLVALDFALPPLSFPPVIVDASGIARTPITLNGPGFPGYNLAFQYLVFEAGSPRPSPLALAKGLRLAKRL